MLRRTLAAVLAAAALVCPAGAQEAYLIGVTGAMTGPAAGTNGPPIEGLRLYVDRLNAGGGINGKKIQLTVLDDQGEPSKAAANAKRLLTQENVSLLVLSSLSSTFAPVIAETKRANVALMLMGAVCPKEVYPPADLLQFCTTAYAGGYDSRARRSPSSRRRRRNRCESVLPPWPSRSRAGKSTMPRSRQRRWA